MNMNMNIKLPLLLLSVASLANAWTPITTVRSSTSTTSLYSSPLSKSRGITLDGSEIRGPITSLGNLVLVKVKDTLTATGGGILLPDQSKERPTEGLVVQAGPGALHAVTGVFQENIIKQGMSVLYGKYDGRPVEYKGEECQYIRDDNVLLFYTGVTMKVATVTPVRDYVLIELEKESADSLKTKSGVVIAAAAMKDASPCQGRVVKTGEGRMNSRGTVTAPPVQVGEIVKFKDYAGNQVMIEGKLYTVVKSGDILCSLNALVNQEE
jgi:chaperonin GroES